MPEPYTLAGERLCSKGTVVAWAGLHMAQWLGLACIWPSGLADPGQFKPSQLLCVRSLLSTLYILYMDITIYGFCEFPARLMTGSVAIDDGIELYCIVLYLLPVLNPKSYDGARVLEASGRPMLVIGRS